MELSCCAWALSNPEPQTLTILSELGLTAVDIRPSWLRSDEACATREELDLDVICLAASHEKPEDATFNSDNPAVVEPLMQHVKEGLVHAASQGARWAYVVPGRQTDAETFERYATHYTAIAEHGQALGVRVCIEHFPGTAFPTVASTLDFIRDTGHPNLYLLFDVGHAQMSNEDPAIALEGVDDRLGYVHLDDNDGINDLHLALTDGVQTRDSLKDFFGVLGDIGYDGPVSLEIKNDLPNPLDAVTRSFATASELMR